MKKIITSILAIFTLLFAANTVQSREITPVPHWQKSPIRVYVPSDDAKTQSMKRAFAKWQAKSYGKLKFRFVAKGPADIDVIFTESAAGSTPISSTSITYNENKISKAEIRIATKSKDFKKYSNDYVYTAMLHEVGRAIGMPVNSRKRSSIMFTPLSVNQDIIKLDIMKLYSIYDWPYANKDTQNTNSKPTEEKAKPTTQNTNKKPTEINANPTEDTTQKPEENTKEDANSSDKSDNKTIDNEKSEDESIPVKNLQDNGVKSDNLKPDLK
jgi:hypothetical protein